MDVTNQRQILWFDGLLALPIGSRINLDNTPALGANLLVPLDPDRFSTGHADAVVVGVRVWGTQGSTPCLVLEVEITDPGGSSGWMIDR
jgi:hypothetical protein